jgi:hypothetical protein
VFLYAGRITVEKNILAFLRPFSASTCPAPRWCDEPQRHALQGRFPAARVYGTLHAHAETFSWAARAEAFRRQRVPFWG